jgi:hypothetical protein
VWATSEFQLGEGGLEVFDDLGGDDVGIGEMIRTIIDISHWEDPIDFKKVAAAGIVAVIEKQRKARPGLIAPMRSSEVSDKV